MITKDESPNTIRNRLIRLIDNWNIIITHYKLDTDKKVLLHIINVMFKEQGIEAIDKESKRGDNILC